MPNWCHNTLTIEHDDPSEIERIKQLLHVGEDVLSFDGFLPTPYDADDWYWWQVNNWGTKWGPVRPTLEHESNGHLHYVYDTAWQPPIAALRVLSRLFPEAVLTLSWDEPAMDFGGCMILRNNDTIRVLESTSRLSSWEELADYEREMEERA